MHELHEEIANILTNNAESAIDLLLQEFESEFELLKAIIAFYAAEHGRNAQRRWMRL